MKKITTLLVSLILVFGLTASTYAACLPDVDDVSSGDTVTCTSVDSNGYITSTSNLTFNILINATVNSAEDGFRLQGNNYSFVNNGIINSGPTDPADNINDGIDIDGQNTTVTNYGTIIGNAQFGANLGGNFSGDLLLTNHGTITGNEHGVVLQGAGIIDNWGKITGGIVGVWVSTAGSTVTNYATGKIVSTGWSAVWVEDDSQTFIIEGTV